SDCFVFPSDYEGQGLVLYEALALSKPIIATDIITSRGILKNKYGELCDNSVEGLVKSMHKFLDGELQFSSFDINEYNKHAMKLFYEKVCNVSLTSGNLV